MRVAYTGMAFVITVLLARLLGPGGFGRYFEAVAWVLLIAGIVQSGWSPFLVREVAALRETEHYGDLLGTARLATTIVLVLAGCAAALLVIATYYAGNRAERGLYILAAPAIVLISTSTVRQAVLRGLGHPLVGQVCENLTRPGVQAVGLLAYWAGLIPGAFTPVAAMAVFLAAISLSALLAWILEKRALARLPAVRARGPADPRVWVRSLLQNSAIGWSSAINLQIGTILLGTMSGDHEVAAFRTALQLSLLLPIGLAAIGTLYANDLSQSFVRNDFPAIQRLAARTSAFSLIAALPLALVYVVAGELIIRLLFGPEFVGAYWPLVALTLGQLANTAFGAVTAICVATRNETAALKAHAVAAIVHVLLCVVLIPLIGALGAAAASAVGMFFWNAILFMFLRRRLGLNPLFGRVRQNS